jgi:hypothetical protein
MNTATEEYDLNLVRACSDISTLQKWRASTAHDNMLNQPRPLDILRILWEETILSTRCQVPDMMIVSSDGDVELLWPGGMVEQTEHR